ncbi:hypothetical protein NQ317_019685 [Molorchus minor]|uniref:N-acetyltransferase domain-containing protein n=1 Tax=Molorchus minor TaxID=1323400 RepID=A0ABQ9J040_9CUCU|nr:hypothetical protein NQ317_019685 [Molorchus minor]
MKLWGVSDDGTIKFVSLTPRHLEGALEVLRKGFYPYESVCIAVKLAQYPQAVADLDQLMTRVSEDGVSIVAIESDTEKVVGVAFNKLQVKNTSGDKSFFEKHAELCTHPSSQRLITFMVEADATCDLFEYCHVDCILELTFLATHPEYRRRGIARKLTEITLELARCLAKGENVRQSMDETELCLESVPGIVSALFTSPTSQKIGRALGWEIAKKISYENFVYEGKSFACILGKDRTDTTLEYKRL